MPGRDLDECPYSYLRFREITTAFLESDITFQNRRGRSHPIKVAMVSRDRFMALLESANLLEQKPPHGDDCRVAGAESFTGTVHAGPHPLLHRLILRRETLIAAHARCALFFTVDQVVIGRVANRPKRHGIDFRVNESFIVDTVPVLSAERRLGIPTHRPNPACVVITRNPAMPMNRKTFLIWNHRVCRK